MHPGCTRRFSLEVVSKLHDKDLAADYDGVFLNDALEKKYPAAAKEFIWQWVFPQKELTLVPDTKKRRRYHLHESQRQEALKKAVRHAKLIKRVKSHTLSAIHMGIQVKETSAADINWLSEIVKTSYQTVADQLGLNASNCPKHPSNCTDEWINSDLERGVTYFLLENEDQKIGCAALEIANEEMCYLERLAILPEHRNNGYGKILGWTIPAVALA